MAISDLYLTIVFILSSFYVVFFSSMSSLSNRKCPRMSSSLSIYGVYCDSSLVCMLYSTK